MLNLRDQKMKLQNYQWYEPRCIWMGKYVMAHFRVLHGLSHTVLELVTIVASINDNGPLSMRSCR